MHFLRFAFAVFFMLTLAATRANPQNGFNGATTSSSVETTAPDGTGTTAKQGWRNALKCKACGLLAGWLLSEVAAGTPIEEYLDQKCGTTFLVASACKLLVASQLQKLIDFHGKTTDELCKTTLHVC